LIGLVTTLVNVCSTPISFYIIEKYGRRSILIWGALGMVICEFIVGIVGVTKGRISENDPAAVRAQIAFICFYIFFFATTWGPGESFR
jgi:MFS family permease